MKKERKKIRMCVVCSVCLTLFVLRKTKTQLRTMWQRDEEMYGWQHKRTREEEERKKNNNMKMEKQNLAYPASSSSSTNYYRH